MKRISNLARLGSWILDGKRPLGWAIALLTFSSLVRAQTASITPSSTTFSPAGGSITLTVNLTYPTTQSALGLSLPTVPAGWAYGSIAGANLPAFAPVAGDTDNFEFLYTAIPVGSASFTFTVHYPAGLSGAQTFSGIAGIFRPEGASLQQVAVPNLVFTAASVPLSITLQPTSQSGIVGGSITFATTAIGNPAPTYQWQRKSVGQPSFTDLSNGSGYTGATTSLLTVSPLALAMSGDQFQCVISSAATTATTTVATLTVDNTVAAPLITTAPIPATKIAGETATFNVVATGNPSPTYVWRKDGVPLSNGGRISNATTASLTVSGVQPSDEGDYSVVATNSQGAVTSAPAALTVNTAPVFTTHPVALFTITEGGNATFTAAATGKPLPTLQWQKDSVNLPGETSTTLTLSSVQRSAAGSYRALASNTVTQNVVSSSTTLDVRFAPAISAAPASVTVPQGQTASFTVTATGNPTPNYQWRRNDVDLPGATNAALSIPNAQSANAGNYTVVVSNGIGSAVTSTAAVLGVTIPTVPPAGGGGGGGGGAPIIIGGGGGGGGSGSATPLIGTGPLSQTVTAGANVSFSVSATGGVLNYQWLKDGAAIAGATNSTLSLTAVTSSAAGAYTVSIGNSSTSVMSSAAILTVQPASIGVPLIKTQPAPQSVAVGGNATFTVVAESAAAVTYQWRRDGITLSGATSPTLALTNVQPDAAGGYSVVVTNTAGSTTSNPAALTVTTKAIGGAYFGTFGGSNGMFALFVRPDRTGEFLGFASNAKLAFIARKILIDAAGHFHAVLATSGSVAPTVAAGQPPTAAAEIEYAIDGVLAQDGSLSGTIAGLNLALAAPPAPSTVTTAALAGFYQAGASGSSATSYTIVGTSGEVLVVTVNGSVVDGGRGTIDASGQLEATTTGNARVSGAVTASAATIALTITPSGGSAIAFAGANNDTREDVEKLVNIATRGQTGADANVMIVGFVVAGDQPKQVLIRVIGPTLESFGVRGALSAVRLELFRGQTLLAAGEDWGAAANATAIAATAVRVGAFPLAPTSRDASLLVALEPGAYSVVASGRGGTTGVGLVEAYDATAGAIPRTQRIINLSTRGVAGAGDNSLIAGFVITGSVPKRVLIRAAGPALAAFGVPGTVARPQLTLFTGATVIAENSGWSGSVDASAISSAAGQVGAFPFAAGSQDAALVVNLSPGAYSAQVASSGGVAGVALVEVYELP